jgi:hypothetical protein
VGRARSNVRHRDLERLPQPERRQDYLSLPKSSTGGKAGGKNHHFKVIQLPLNLGMTEALSLATRPSRKRLNDTEAAKPSASPSCAARPFSKGN